MALRDQLTSFIDNMGLAEVFSRRAPDPAKARKPLLKGIESCRRQFDSGQIKVPNRWWRVSNGVVALPVKLGGRTLDINGEATNHIPVERFPEFLDRFHAAVLAGEFDSELASDGHGDAHVTVPRASRKGTISPEAAKLRGQKAAASRARNRAAREQG